MVHMILKILRSSSGREVYFQTGRRKELDSILDRACRPSSSEFSVVFSKTPRDSGYDPLERPHGGNSTNRPRSLLGQLNSILQPTKQLNRNIFTIESLNFA